MVKSTSKVPQLLSAVMSEETFNKARAYSSDRIDYSLFKTVFVSLGLTSLEIYYGFLPALWTAARSTTARLGLDASGEITVSCVFIVLMSIVGTLKELPFGIYSTFVVEERHGFNKQTAGFYAKDQVKSFVLSQVLALPIVCAVIYIVQVGGPHFYVWLWLFVGVVTLVLLTVYPIFIAPLFDKYSPLEAGPLRTAIEELAGRLHFPLTKLYVVEGSKRSAHSNAYFYGLWNSKRIVLFDTLLADYKPAGGEKPTVETESDQAALAAKDAKPAASGCQNDEVIAVLAHELGHWKLNHVTKNIVVGQVHMFLMFAAFGYLFSNRSLYQIFGFADGERPVLIGLILICNYILAMYNALISFGVTVMSRRFEYQADAFAVKLGYAEPMARALVKLNADNLGFPVFDWLYSAWNHSHPSLLHRLARLSGAADKKAANKKTE